MNANGMVSETVVVAIQKLPGNEDLPLPRYMTEHAAGLDLFAAVRQDVTILSQNLPIMITTPKGIPSVLDGITGFAGNTRDELQTELFLLNTCASCATTT